MKTFLVILLNIFVSHLSFAQIMGNSEFAQVDAKILEFPDTLPSKIDSEAWSYKILRTVIVDMDNIFKDAGVEVEVCSYKNNQTGITKSYKSLSDCLFERIISWDYRQKEGPVFFWVQDKHKKHVPVRVDWSPNPEGWRGVFKEVFALQMESFSKWWMNFTMKKAEDRIKQPKFKHNFLGQIKMSLPPGSYITDIFLEKNFLTMLLKLDQASQISLEMNPTEIKNHQVQYEGQLLVSRKAALNSTGDIITFDFKTNINLLKLERPYQTEGKSGGAQNAEEFLK